MAFHAFPRDRRVLAPAILLGALLLAPAVAPAAVPVFVDDEPGAPVRSVEIGGDLRMRGYDLENMWDADSDDERDHWAVFRQRARLFCRVELEQGVVGFLRVANQNWGEGVTAAAQWEEDNKSNKLFVDAAWIDAAGLFGLPVSARFGRQSLSYGSGFVLFDGQSQLASTAMYMDGVRLRVAPDDRFDLDLLYFKDQENARDEAAHDDITLAGVYFSRRDPDRDGSDELYALRREDQNLGRRIWALGLRTCGVQDSGLDYDLEATLQLGDSGPSRDHEAWGFKGELGYSLPELTWAPRPFVSFVGLSGDDPFTSADERWDVVYGGWPQFGDLLAWSYLNLGAYNRVSVFDPGYASGSSVPGEVVYGNLLLPTIGLDLHPVAGLDARLSFSPITVQESAADSDDFGEYYQLSARYRHSQHLSFAAYAALIDIGAAFGPDADAQHELFWETRLEF